MKWLKLAFLITVGCLIASQLDNPVITHITDKNWLVNYTQQHGVAGDIVILLSSIVFLSISGPKQIIALVFGYLYHIYLGVALTLLACVIAAAINYISARFLIGAWLFKRFPQRMMRFNAFASHRPFFKILLLRLFPIGNNVVTNVLSGSVRVPLAAFFSASVLGYLPQTIIFALMGAGIQSSSNYLIYLSISFAVASTVLTGYLYRDHIKNRVEQLKMEEAS